MFRNDGQKLESEYIVWDEYISSTQKAFSQSGKYIRNKSHTILVSAIIDYIHPKKDESKQLSA